VDASDGGGRKDGLAVDAVSAEDVISLVLTFFLAIVVTLGVLIWGRVTASQRT
jgi:hypothetical protein